MKIVSVAVALLLAAAPLAAQRGGGVGGGVGRGAGGPTRVPPPGGLGLPRGAFLDPGVPERRPSIPGEPGPVPFPPADREWLRLTTPHFVFLSAIGEHATRATAHDLEKLTLLLTRTNDRFHLPSQPTRIILFAEHRVAQPYFDALRGARVDASGITLRHPKGTTMLVDTTAIGAGTLTPRHELVHDLLHSDERPAPLWIEEGLGEYYSNAGQPIREHVSRLRGRLRIPLQQLFAVNARDPSAWTFDFYAESWASVATLMRRDPQAFFAVLRDIEQGIDPAASIRSNFRWSLRELETAMRKSAALPAPSLLLGAAPPMPMELSPMPRAEVLYELGELLTRVQWREADAERHLRAAIETGPESGAMHLAYAELLLAMPNRAVDARVQAQAAIDFDRGLEARGNGLIGLSYLAAGDPAAARSYLEHTADGVDFVYPLFTIYVDQGERDLADQAFVRLLDTPRANEARRRLLDAEIPRADALAREGRLVEAAKILRDLALKMPEKTRANLETQAVRLESIAASAPR